MDPNRNSSECCQNQNDDCHRSYNDYHGLIREQFENAFMINGTRQYEQGLLIDVHGQAHPEKWIELGYMLSSIDLNAETLKRPAISSVRRMAALSEFTFEEIVRGNKSLGGILYNKFNLKVVPSPQYLSPKEGRYYSGGFISWSHGSIRCANHRVSALQIELPRYLRETPNIESTGKTMASAIYEYYMVNKMDKLVSNQTQKCV